MKTDKKWYQEPTFKKMMLGLTTLMVVFTIGTWVVDGEIGEMGAIYLFGGALIVAPIMTYLMRNNP